MDMEDRIFKGPELEELRCRTIQDFDGGKLEEQDNIMVEMSSITLRKRTILKFCITIPCIHSHKILLNQPHKDMKNGALNTITNRN